jgi:hypothetical protein
LAAGINLSRQQQERAHTIAQQAQAQARRRFHRDVINQQIAQLLQQVLAGQRSQRVTAKSLQTEM